MLAAEYGKHVSLMLMSDLCNTVVVRAVKNSWVFGRPFVKRFALCYRTFVLSVCPGGDVGVLRPNGLEGSICHLVRR